MLISPAHKGCWDKKLVVTIILFALTVFAAIILFFYDKLVDYSYIIGGILVISFYFLFMNFLFHAWREISSRKFQWNLLIASFVVRVIVAMALFIYYKSQTGEPFEYQAIDSKFYHFTALKMAEHFRNMDFNIANYISDLSFSDKGYNIYLAVIYTFWPSIIVVRILNAFFSACTVWLIYKTGDAVIDNHTGRIAGIMAMLLPNFLLYLGTHLKESLMLFLVVLTAYQVIRFIHFQQRGPGLIISLILLLFSLFTFRTVLAAAMLTAFVGYALIYHPFKNKMINISAMILLLAGFAYLALNSQIGAEIAEYLEKKNAVSDHMEFRATRDGGNKLALLAGAPLFLSIIFIAPFPSFVFVPEQNPLWLFIGANFIRNVYAFFTIAGIIYLLKERIRKAYLIILFAVCYLGILANSGFAISERFHMPAVPFLLLLAATGISHRKKAMPPFFIFYLVFTGILILGWNFVKLAGRA